VIDDWGRGALLYSLAGVVLLGGGLWFFRAAPATGDDPRVAGWRETAERLLPELPLQASAETMVLVSGASVERNTPVDGGSYTLSMVCAGTGRIRVQLSASGNDSGRAVSCSDDPDADRVRVALADEFYIRVSVEDDDGGAVFRWRLERSRRY
jgi:hypothetical protein